MVLVIDVCKSFIFKLKMFSVRKKYMGNTWEETRGLYVG